MKLAVVAVLLALAAPPAKADDTSSGAIAVAVAADGHAPGLRATLDSLIYQHRAAPGSVGVVVAGSSVVVPLQPLAALSGDSLQVESASGSLADAEDLALALLDRAAPSKKLLIVLGPADDELLRRAVRANVQVLATQAGADRMSAERTTIVYRPSEPAPAAPPSRWPALALLALAALISRRAIRA